MSYKDPIFRGCTRPAMLAGVPMMPFLFTTGAALLLTIWLAFLVSIYAAVFIAAMYLPALITMREQTKKDDQRLRQMWQRLRIRSRHGAGKRLWGAVSYSPIRYKTRSGQ